MTKYHQIATTVPDVSWRLLRRIWHLSDVGRGQIDRLLDGMTSGQQRNQLHSTSHMGQTLSVRLLFVLTDRLNNGLGFVYTLQILIEFVFIPKCEAAITTAFRTAALHRRKQSSRFCLMLFLVGLMQLGCFPIQVLRCIFVCPTLEKINNTVSIVCMH